MNRQILSGTFWSLAENWANQFLQLLIFMVLARYLLPEQFGLAATAILLCQLLQNILLAGVNAPMVRMAEDDIAADSTGFWIGAGLGALLLLVLLLGAAPIEAAYGMPGLAPVLRLLGIGGLFAGLAVAYQARMMRHLDFRPLALRTLVGTTAGGLVGVALAMRGAGVESLVAQFIIAALLALLVLVATSPWQPSFRWSNAAAGRIGRFGGHVSATALINFFNENADVLIVGYALGPAAAGTYIVGKRALIAGNALLSGALARVALPAFSRLRDDRPQLSRHFLSAVEMTALFTVPAFAGLALVAPEFLLLFFGPQWVGASTVMQALCVFGILQSLGVYNHAVVLALGKPQWQTALTLTYAVANLLAAAFVVRYGAAAVAIAVTARGYLLYPLSIALVMRLVPLRVSSYLKALALPVMGAVVMCAGVMLARPMLADWPPSTRLIALIMTGAVVYGLVLVLVGRRDLQTLVRKFAPLRAGGSLAESRG